MARSPRGWRATPTVLSALMAASDHLPVVADYQLPAVLDVFTAAVPSILSLHQAFQLAVTVSNAADVLVSLGADELITHSRPPAAFPARSTVPTRRWAATTSIS